MHPQGPRWTTAGALVAVAVSVAAAKPHPKAILEPSPPPQFEDPSPANAKSALQIASGDTTWIADWSFDAGGGTCDDTGWLHADNRMLNDGSNYWHTSDVFAGTGGIVNHAAVLSKHDLVWVRDGYGNSWDYSIVLQYRGAGATLGFDYLSDGESGYDFVTVEADSAGASESRVDYGVDPSAGPDHYRSELLSVSGVQNTSVNALALPDFGVPATIHEAYIRFASGSKYSDEDGGYPSQWNAGLVVDNIVVTGALAYTEDFEAALGPNVSFVNTAPATPFGEWARLYQHITDNDPCSENKTCAWLFTDPSLPAASPATAFGPGGAVVRNWLDDVLISPWVSLGAGPGATILSYRRFPGNDFNKSRILMSWSVRSQVRVDNTDTSAPGDSIDAVTPWQPSSWNSLTTFSWITSIANVSAYVPATATAVQVRFRVSDAQYILGYGPPATVDPGPGPFLDRVRIGRRAYVGAHIDVPIPTGGAHLAQDTFPGVLQTYSCAWLTVSTHVPTTDRFGTCDFSQAQAQAWSQLPENCFARCDSIRFFVHDEAGAGIADVWLLGAIVSGPHAGKAPPPWTVEPSGFFRVPARRGGQCFSTSPFPDLYTTDLDDEYFRGGDVLLYMLVATDQQGGFDSYPPGLAAEPTSVAQAEEATGGLLEVSFLPTIDWDPAYLARIAADPNGKLDPTPEEIANSSQHSCMLYVNQQTSIPRHGLAHRTAFLRTLDRLGYADRCDVYDVNGLGSYTNNQIAGRATLEQLTGYTLVVYDAGREYTASGLSNLPYWSEGFYDQAQWYRDWLARGPTSEAGRATFWAMGSQLAEAVWSPNALVFGDMGVTFLSASQPAGITPEIIGQTSFTWADSTTTDFTADSLRIRATACPGAFAYNGIGASGTAVVSHRFEPGSTPGEGGIVLNANPAAGWNTIFASLDWGALYETEGNPPGTPADVLAGRILQAVLPDCQAAVNPTDVAHGRPSLPAVTRLRGNVPNPFNPTTTIVFDLQRDGPVRIQIYDVAGRRLRTLVDGSLPAGWRHRAVWNGMDDSGTPVASGLYFVHLETDQVTATRKMVLVR